VKESRSSIDETSLLESLRKGNQAAFTQLVEHYHTSLVRLASLYIHDESVAEEVAQETWLAVLKGLKRFEGRSSLKTWIFTILTNRAKTYSLREPRALVFSELEEESFENQPTVDPERFSPPGTQDSPGHWVGVPKLWTNIPEEAFLSAEMLGIIEAAIVFLPENQQAVITLRDLDGFSSEEVCNVLGISETNQRVLLHRARAKVRKALEDYLLLEH
jgi:RNA polymerase sigma-70 factor (ECF subfamily)